MSLQRCLLDLAAKWLLVMQAGDCLEVSRRDGGSRAEENEVKQREHVVYFFPLGGLAK